jgi:hypothetical protein
VIRQLLLHLVLPLLLLAVLLLALGRSCEAERKEDRARDIERCKARHLFGEEATYNEHFGCLRKTPEGHWEKVQE